MKLEPITLYDTLLENYGKQNWWPVDHLYHINNNTDPRFEIIIGAILTQNTAWSNVEKAIKNLKQNKKMDIKNINKIDIAELKKLIKPSGFYNQKAIRLKNFSRYLKNNYSNNIDNLFNKETYELRKELLSLNGIGQETADSILLYAGKKPVFVVDAYTKRICKRIPIKNLDSYNDIQKYFQKKLSKKYSKKQDQVKIYNELHALIVIFAKQFCKKKPDCEMCIIQKKCKYYKNII